VAGTSRGVVEIVIADDHPLILAGIRAALELDGSFAVVGEARASAEVLPLLERLEPAVLLLDRGMPAIDALAFLDRMARRHPKVKVVLMSEEDDPELVQAAFSRGAVGYILKRIDPIDLPSAIRQAVEGTAYHAHGLPAISQDSAAKTAGLTERELAVIKAVARGLSNQAIGKELWVTEQTVKFHLTNVYRKLGVVNRTEAVRWAVGRGLV
jgi:two-component system, NarL family, response regulator DegU